LVTVYEEGTSILPGDDFSNIMISDVNMFGASLSDRVGCYEDRTLIISADWDWLEAVSELPHKGMHPDNLVAAIGERHVLSLGGGQSNSFLCFRYPGYKTTVRADLGGHLKYSRRWSGVRAGVLLGAQGAVRRGENRGEL